ncbi:MAG TPA: tRNA lysidine(34) synthetase TilS [Bacteroidales bacterium]|nr:tRNA lysidine(34) synthetase TilS [Bacteroidales bacterium]
MQSRFIDFALSNNLLHSDDKILLGVSGGIDSMVMLNLFYKAGFNFSVAHCNFSLRGNESDGDEHLVIDVCREKGIKLHRIKFETGRYAIDNKLSIQVAARDLRYRWFNSLCDEHGYNKIAIAHNRDDVAETVIFNLSRGTGLKGLSGIKVVNGRVIRPLLAFSRNEIVDYAKENQIHFRDDSSNSSVKYARNRIRHNVLPELEKLNPSVKKSIAETASHIHEAWNLVENYLLKLKEKVVTFENEKVLYSIQLLLNERYCKLFLLEELVPYGFSHDSIEQVVESLQSQPGKIFYSSTHQLLRDRKHFVLTEKHKEEQSVVKIDKDCKSINNPVSLKFDLVDRPDVLDLINDPFVATLDYDKLIFPLELRLWQPGDRFMPFGMNQFKKISDFLIDKKVSLVDKEKVYVLISNDDIVWVVGYRIDNRFKITENTKRLMISRVVSY